MGEVYNDSTTVGRETCLTTGTCCLTGIYDVVITYDNVDDEVDIDEHDDYRYEPHHHRPPPWGRWMGETRGGGDGERGEV